MPRDGSATRGRILDAGLKLILDQGYAGTSVDQLIELAGVTKGTFFYHFSTKQKLAEALVHRWMDEDIQHLDRNLARARKLAREPQQQLFIFVSLFEEMFEQPATEQVGCLYASLCYETQVFDPDIARMIRQTFDVWRERLVPVFEAAITATRPRRTVSAVELVDMLAVVFEGSFILSRIYGDREMVGVHLRHYRNYLELVFDAP